MIYLELFYVFFLIGLFTFGGGYAMIPLIESETISRGLLDTKTFYDMIAISESTPGPIAINMATFIGYKNAGFLGGLISTIGVILPSFIILLLIASILTKIMNKRVVKAILNGFKGVVVGLILSTAIIFLYNNAFIEEEVFKFSIESIAIFLIIISISLTYKYFKKKPLSPYIIIIIGACLGLLNYFI